MKSSLIRLSIVCSLIAGAVAGPWFDPWCANFAKNSDPSRPPHQSRIVFGDTTLKGELKYQVQILWYWNLVCGGTLIQVGDTQAILTAAHCVSGPDPFFYSIQASDWDLEHYETEQLREVDQIYFPDDYDKSRPYENDIAIITLNEPFELNNLTAPIPLPPQGEELNSNRTLLSSGWGQYFPGVGDLTCKLKKIGLPQVDAETCQGVYTEHGVQLSESMFCVGIMENEEDNIDIGPCDVDFGGPLVDEEAGYLAGIMLHSPRCGYVGYPTVSTKVSHYVSWIESKLLNTTRNH